MSDDLIDLRSVNWARGMFLTPDHFVRQERYVDSLFLWVMRHTLNMAGLIGGGPRLSAAERGSARFDPVVDIEDTADTLRVAVSQCRGVTRGGAIIDIDASAPVRGNFQKRSLEGALELSVYVVARPHTKDLDASVADPVNKGAAPAARRASYSLTVDVTADDADWALLIARVQRAEHGVAFERAPGFIPPCAFMCAHTGLMDAYRYLNDMVVTTADRYGTLHRAIADYVRVARARGIPVEQDVEALDFVGKMVLTLEQGAFALQDPVQAPRLYFQELSRITRSSALFLSLSPATREYFRLLGDIGSPEFSALLTQDDEVLESSRRWSPHDDLAADAGRARRSIERLARLEQALEGKYLDYRLSPSLDGLNFVFDRTAGDAVLYRTVSKAVRPQAQGQEVTFVFAPLRLEERDTYRVILLGDRAARFTTGDRLAVEVRVNARQQPEFREASHEVSDQRNFAVDFRPPDDIPTITDVRVTVRTGQPLRGAILYVRGRLSSTAAAVSAPSAMPSPERIASQQRPIAPQQENWDRQQPVQAPRRESRLREGEPTDPDPGPRPTPRRRLS